MADGVFAVLSDRLAPKGYAYLLVCSGWGTVASCLFDDYANAREYRERARAFFEKHAGLRMRCGTDVRGHGQPARGADRRARRGAVRRRGRGAAGCALGLRHALRPGLRATWRLGPSSRRTPRDYETVAAGALRRVPAHLGREPLTSTSGSATPGTRGSCAGSRGPRTPATGCAGSTLRASGRASCFPRGAHRRGVRSPAGGSRRARRHATV